MRGVQINLGDGNLGQVLQTNDGICGLVTHGVSESGGYTLGTTVLLTGVASLATEGITVGNNPFAYKQVAEFYSQAGNGAQLYLMLVPNTMLVNQMADKTNSSGAIKLLNYAAGAIKVLGLVSDDTVVTAPTITAALNASCYTAITNAQALAAQFASQQFPLRVIVGGTSYSGVPGNLTSQTTSTNNRVMLFIGDTEPSTGYSGGKGACVGLVLGMVSSIPVQRKISRTKNGAVVVNGYYTSNAEVYVGTATLETYTTANVDVMSGKGIVSWYLYNNLSGYFFSGDQTCTATTDDYCFLCRGRVIDKAQVIAYQTFIQDTDDEVPTVPVTGLIDPGYAANLQKTIEQQINAAMTSQGNCDGCTAFVDPSQNVVQNNEVDVTLSVAGVAYASLIKVNLGFEL